MIEKTAGIAGFPHRKFDCRTFEPGDLLSASDLAGFSFC